MKKYSDKHLESVEPEFIVAFEETVRLLESGHDEISWGTCPAFICVFGREYCVSWAGWCPTNFKYKGSCPCIEFGEYECIRMGKNLIQQWKSWAGVE